MKINQLLADLQALVTAPEDRVPKEFLSSKDWAKKWGLSRNHAQKLLTAGVKAGRIEEKRFRIATGKRGPHPTPFYRDVKA